MPLFRDQNDDNFKLKSLKKVSIRYLDETIRSKKFAERRSHITRYDFLEAFIFLRYIHHWDCTFYRVHKKRSFHFVWHK